MNRTGRAVIAAAIAVIVSSFACTTLEPQSAVNASSVLVNTGLTTIQVGQTIQASAAVKNALGASLDGVDIGWSSSNPAIATISSSGLITGVAPGTTDVTATIARGSASVTLTVVPASPLAAGLSITTQPPITAPSGAAFSASAVIQLQDEAGAPVPQSGVIVTASIASGEGTLGGTLTSSTNTSGVATFGNLSITGTVGPRTLAFSAPGLPAVPSGPIDITPGAPAALTIAIQPAATVQSAVVLSQQPGIQVRDVSGNAVPQSGIIVTATIATGGGTLGGTATVTTDANGIATFTDLSVTGAAGARTLSFSANGLTSATTDAIDVTAGTSAPAAVAITTQPSAAAQSGIALAQQPVVQIRDGTGSLVNQAGVSVTAAIAIGGGTLGGTTTVTTNASGVATFTNLSLTSVVGPHTLRFSSGSLAPATSNAVTLSAGAASALTITTQPSAAGTSGVALPQQPAIQIRDASGNPVKQAGIAVTVDIAPGGGGTLAGNTTAFANTNGVATFTNLSITGAPGPRTLTFASGLLAPATSGSIDIADPAIAPAALTITTQPSTATMSGTVIVQQPVIQLRDAVGSAVSQAGITVTAAIASGGGTLAGAVTAVTNADGAAAFTNLSISGMAPGDRTLSFTSGSLTPVTSNPVTVSVGPVSALTITSQPSASVQSGSTLAAQPAVQIRDATGNPISQGGIFVSAAIASGGGTLAGAGTVSTNASGVATFTGLSITGTPGPRTLSFSSGSLAPATSSTIEVTAPPMLSVTTQPSATAQSGVVLGQQPVIQLRDGSGNALGQAGVSVTATISNGGGTLGGAATVVTNASGVATFVGLSISGAIGARTLGFTAPGFVSTSSAVVNITAGAATTLSISTQPSASVVSGASFPQQPAVRLRDASGNAVSQADVNVTAVIASGGGTLGGTTTATTTASGIATFTDLSITGPDGARTLTFSAPGLTSVTSGPVTVGPASGLPAEPTFTAGQVMFFTDDMNYTDLAAAVAGGWRTRAQLATQDVTTNAGGANRIISPGFDGTGSALRLIYDGIANGGGQESHGWWHNASAAGWDTPRDVLAAAPGKALYVSYYFRLTGGGGFTVDQDFSHRPQIKWLELWTNTARSQFSPAPNLSYQNVPPEAGADGGSAFVFIGQTAPRTMNEPGGTSRWAQQVRRPFLRELQGGWHRATIKIMNQSAAGARDGVAQMWIDGTLIVNAALPFCGQLVPDAVGGAAIGNTQRSPDPGPAKWCDVTDLDGMLVGNYIWFLDFGEVNAGALWPFTVDYDRVIAWRDP